MTFGRFVASSLVVITAGSFALYGLQSGIHQWEPQAEAQQRPEASGPNVTPLSTRLPQNTTATVQKPEDLPIGQPLLYYLKSFEQLGLEPVEIQQSSRGPVFDLVSRQNPPQTSGTQRETPEVRYRISLIMPEPNADITEIHLLKSVIRGGKPGIPTPSLANGEETIDQVERDIAKIQPGRLPAEYVSDMGRLGRVTQYELLADDPTLPRAVITFEKEGKLYTVDLILGPEQRVADIQVTASYWRILLG